MSQLAAHRAGTDLHAGATGDARTELAEREVGLMLDFCPEDWCVVLESTLRTVPLRPRGGLTGLPFSAQPFFKGRQTDMKTRGDEGLCLPSGKGFGQDTFPQILAIGSHAPKSSRFVP